MEFPVRRLRRCRRKGSTNYRRQSGYYTLYHGRNSDILCTRYKASNFVVPPGAVGEMHDHLLYKYKGYSLCVTVSEQGRFICVLTTSEPMDELRHDISLARAFSIVR